MTEPIREVWIARSMGGKHQRMWDTKPVERNLPFDWTVYRVPLATPDMLHELDRLRALADARELVVLCHQCARVLERAEAEAVDAACSGEMRDG